MPKNAEAIAGDIASAPGSARYRRRGPVKRTPIYPHGPGVKWPRLYRKFRRKGWTKEKAARVSNEMYNKIKSGRYKRRKPRPPFPGVGGVYPGGNATALARGISSDMARYGRVNPKTVRGGVGKRDSVEKGRGGLGRWFNEKWVDISRPLPEGGFAPCGRKDASKGAYPKCVPEAVALKMSQKQIDSAVRRKRRAESTQEREGQKPINVATFTKSKNVPVDAALYARVKAEAKRKFDVYPSAYANGWLVQEYKRRGGRYRVEKARYVATMAGVRRYGLSIGSEIKAKKPKPRVNYRAPKSQQPGGGTTIIRSQPRNRSRDRLAMFERGGMSGSNTPEALARAIIENGGVTYNPRRNERRSTGVAVAIDKQYEKKIPVDDFVDNGERYIQEFVNKHEKMLSQPNIHLGAWVEDGLVYLDLSVVTSDLDEAANIGRKHDQIGLFHLSTFSDWKRIPVNGVYRYVPVNSDDAEAFDDLVDLTPAMFTLLETISKASQKRLTRNPVIFISGADINEDTIPKIHKEICACAGVVKKAYGKKKAPKGYHYMPDGKLMRDDEHVEKGLRAVPRDGDGDGFYSLGPGMPDRTPLPFSANRRRATRSARSTEPKKQPTIDTDLEPVESESVKVGDIRNRHGAAHRPTRDVEVTKLVASALDGVHPKGVVFMTPERGWEDVERRIARDGRKMAVGRMEKVANNMNACHQNTAKLVSSNPKRYKHVLGYALNGDMWRSHSWAWDMQEEEVVETTSVSRDAYFGVVLTEKERSMFA